jgi:hypothetical protein
MCTLLTRIATESISSCVRMESCLRFWNWNQKVERGTPL